MDSSETTSVEVVVFNGFDELDALGPYEVLENAKDAGANLDVELVTLGGATSATGNHDLTVASQGALSDHADLLVVPGGSWDGRAVAGAWAEVQAGDLPEAVRLAHQRGAIVGSVCTGAMILEAGGLLDGKRATTHHGAMEDLRESGAEAVDARVVDEGDVVTAGGVTAGLDLGFWLVERFWGVDLADEIAREMEYERSDDVVA
ncbi:ThiJ/PfpI domain-containing protein [Salinarchaeum sp. Harcht-Bsk1]|uniref:DJ-1/PfpI family protein n=1 Tax=Salinarchaeum sp. Harcht-Bsk1 TaxID=1333523 RepID=UPI00034243D3|nr:DJ-1/PfpI family protein [Salinarchaeum sp. Harcht-Bsk1]AGN00044.1 ThiJ/PfpI domain-containing protein [Salinarchaeum sp. Harcht-Bsk1]